MMQKEGGTRIETQEVREKRLNMRGVFISTFVLKITLYNTNSLIDISPPGNVTFTD